MGVKRNLESTVRFKGLYATRKDQHELTLIPEFMMAQFLKIILYCLISYRIKVLFLNKKNLIL